MPTDPPTPDGERPASRSPLRAESGVRPAAEQLLALADEVALRGTETRRQVDELEVALARLSGRGQSGAAPAPRPRRPRPAAHGPSPAGGETVRLVAVEMAATGRSRAEVAAHLSQAFGVSDATATLDEVFGEGSRD
jgi:hypothetical protein